MRDSKLGGKSNLPSTRSMLDIAEIREDTVVMRDGTLRAVILVSSINFALKSTDEQNAIISAYMSFLNSFDFPFQIIIQSRKLKIADYLNGLLQKEKEQVNELLKMQISDYRQFVAELVKLGDIMTKQFYMVVPYNPASDMKRGFLSKLADLLSPGKVIGVSREKFMRFRHELEQRVSHVLSGLQSMGLSAVALDTQGLIELYYNSYNIDSADLQKLPEMDKLKIEQ